MCSIEIQYNYKFRISYNNKYINNIIVIRNYLKKTQKTTKRLVNTLHYDHTGLQCEKLTVYRNNEENNLLGHVVL